MNYRTSIDTNGRTFRLESRHGVTICRYNNNGTFQVLRQEGNGCCGRDFDEPCMTNKWYDVNGVQTKFTVPVVLSSDDNWPNVRKGCFLRFAWGIFLQVERVEEIVKEERWQHFLSECQNRFEHADEQMPVSLCFEVVVESHRRRWCTVVSVDKGLWKFLKGAENCHLLFEFVHMFRKDCTDKMFAHLKQTFANSPKCDECNEPAHGLSTNTVHVSETEIHSSWSLCCRNHQFHCTTETFQCKEQICARKT